jgi:hypothetical protein
MVLEKCFTDEFISSRAGNNIDKKKIYEKVVYAFYSLVETGNIYVKM